MHTYNNFSLTLFHNGLLNRFNSTCFRIVFISSSCSYFTGSKVGNFNGTQTFIFIKYPFNIDADFAFNGFLIFDGLRPDFNNVFRRCYIRVGQFIFREVGVVF